jgi:Domain of unknown function (DUF4166)
MDAGWVVERSDLSRTSTAAHEPAAVDSVLPRELPADAGPGPFRRLVGEAAWQQLPLPVQQRFDRVLAPGESAAFVGEIAATRFTAFGRLTAQLARVAGAPLPLRALERTAAAVLVTEDHDSGAQAWTRVYQEHGRLPQVIRSMKRFAGPTGLEECVGAGIGMALTVHVEQRALVIRSAQYFCRLCGRRFRIPDWLTPGRIEIVHREERRGRFSFTLTVTHPRFGVTIQQVAFFRDVC